MIDILYLTFEGECGAGLHCKQRKECFAFQEQKANLDAMTSLTPEWEELASNLTAMKCDGVENGVCCKSNRKRETSTENVKVISGECEEGFQCKPMEECPAFKEQESKLESLTLWSPEREALASKMKDLRCSSSKNNSVCCETNGGCFRSDLAFSHIDGNQALPF